MIDDLEKVILKYGKKKEEEKWISKCTILLNLPKYPTKQHPINTKNTNFLFIYWVVSRITQHFGLSNISFHPS